MRGVALCLCVVLFAGTLTGCSKIVFSTGVHGKQILKVNGEVCTKSEALVYLTTLQNEYKSAYGVNLWNSTEYESELVDYVKEKTMYRLQHVFCMYLLAQEMNITLTSAEEAQIAEAAEAYYTSLSDEEISYLGVSKADIETYYTRFTYAEKVFDEITEDVNMEISDDEARVMEAQVIYTTDSTKAATVENLLSSGTDLSSIASTYTELSEVTMNIARGDFPDEVEDVIFALEDDETSGCITADDGYYFVKCVSKINEELTEEHREALLESAYEEAFDETYEAFISSAIIEINEKSWNSLELSQDENLKSTEFFNIYNQYFAED